MMKQKDLTFSIVVPTHNRPAQLSCLLQSLTHLKYPRDCFEVIVVDDGSEMTLATTVAPFQDQCNLVLLSQRRAGPANARQVGIGVAKGEFLAFTDDDCSPAADWLKIMADYFARIPDCALGGQTLNALSTNVYSTASQLLTNYLYAYCNADPCQARFFTTNNMALSADRFHAAGGLDPSWSISGGEDRDLCRRLLHHDCRMIYVPEMVVYHAHSLAFRTFWQQHFNYGRGAFRFRQAWTRHPHGGIRLEPLSFYLNLPRFAFSQVGGYRAYLIAALLVLSQVANAAGFCWEKLKSSRNGFSQ